MEALYDFLPVPGTKNSEKSPKLYPKLVTRGAVPFSEIIRQIARSSGFKEGTVIGVMEEVEKWTSFYISRGECVEIGHMAYAVANLKAGKEITDEGEIHAQTIRFDKVRFRTSKSFNRRCKGQELSRVRTEWKFQQSSSLYSLEERLHLHIDYLQQNPLPADEAGRSDMHRLLDVTLLEERAVLFVIDSVAFARMVMELSAVFKSY